MIFLGAFIARNCDNKLTFFCQYEVRIQFQSYENKNLTRLLFVVARNSSSRRCLGSLTTLLEYTSEECDLKCISVSV